MVDKRHRTSMSGIKVQSEYAWGINKATERYGKSEHLHGAPQPKDTPFPKDKEGSARNFNDVPTGSWRYDGQGRKPRD
jgi:hypothetical protein